MKLPYRDPVRIDRQWFTGSLQLPLFRLTEVLLGARLSAGQRWEVEQRAREHAERGCLSLTALRLRHQAQMQAIDGKTQGRVAAVLQSLPIGFCLYEGNEVDVLSAVGVGKAILAILGSIPAALLGEAERDLIRDTISLFGFLDGVIDQVEPQAVLLTNAVSVFNYMFFEASGDGVLNDMELYQFLLNRLCGDCWENSRENGSNFARFSLMIRYLAGLLVKLKRQLDPEVFECLVQHLRYAPGAMLRAHRAAEDWLSLTDLSYAGDYSTAVRALTILVMGLAGRPVAEVRDRNLLEIGKLLETIVRLGNDAIGMERWLAGKAKHPDARDAIVRHVLAGTTWRYEDLDLETVLNNPDLLAQFEDATRLTWRKIENLIGLIGEYLPAALAATSSSALQFTLLNMFEMLAFMYHDINNVDYQTRPVYSVFRAMRETLPSLKT